MKHDAQLTQEQRYPMDAYRKAGLSQTETAKKLRGNKSTISREIRRNHGWRGDRAQPAQKRCLARRTGSHGSRIGVSDWQRVETLIRQEWSPAEIREWLTREGQRPISHEWIYQYLKRDRQAGGALYRSLRCQRQRRKRHGRPERRGHLKNRVSIEARPALVERRCRIGDGEGDTLIGPRHPGVLVSPVERRSG
jgi:IS30 family transposase